MAAMTASDYRDERREILGNRQVAGVGLVDALTKLTYRFLTDIAAEARRWDQGWSLVAVGGTGRGEICPGSDIDLVLLHPRKASLTEAGKLSESIWYPIWDAGLKGTPSVHSIDSALALGDREVVSAATWLSAVHLIGDEAVSSEFADRSVSRWRERAKLYLPRLFDETTRRHERAGEVAFHLEPDLRDGRGGLRDAHVLQFCGLASFVADDDYLQRAISRVRPLAATLLSVRAELHRATNRPGDRLALQEQDGVAAAAGFDSADDLMAAVAATGRSIAWATEEAIRRVSRSFQGRPKASMVKTAKKLTSDFGLLDDELVLLDSADRVGDPTLILRLGAYAAQEQQAIAPSTLADLAQTAPPIPTPWPERARNALVTLLGAGPYGTHILEALDHYDLVTRFLPEWSAVRSKPQRNAYHRFTVDRHLCETAAQSSELVRTVTRPDLLLVGSWLHDIGKGFPGDHTDVGIDMMSEIAGRMGFPADDIGVLCDLVRYHLLLPEVATRRDLSDPGTINSVATAVGDLERLMLLSALTKADSISTGPTAWSDWKEGLVNDLVRRTADALGGSGTVALRSRTTEQELLLSDSRSLNRVVVHIARASVDVETVAIAAPDRPGLFAAIAGSITLAGGDILSADVWTTDDEFAVDVFRVTRQMGGATDPKKLESLIDRALAGTLDVDAELVKRARSYRRSKPQGAGHAAAPSVIVDNDTPELATVFELRAPDAPAVLYRVTKAISALGFDLRTATVATIGHEVVDTFAVRTIDAEGRKAKLVDDALIDRLRVAMLASIADGDPSSEASQTARP